MKKVILSTLLSAGLLLVPFGCDRHPAKGNPETSGGETPVKQIPVVDSPSSVLIGERLAKTQLPDLSGTVRSLPKFAGEGGLVAIFVDTTCPFAATAIADTAVIAGQLDEFKIPCVLINIEDPKADVLAFYEGVSDNVPVLYDTSEATKERWQITSVPTVMFFDRTGDQVYRGGGIWADLAVAVEGALDLEPGWIKFNAQGTEYG